MTMSNKDERAWREHSEKLLRMRAAEEEQVRLRIAELLRWEKERAEKNYMLFETEKRLHESGGLLEIARWLHRHSPGLADAVLKDKLHILDAFAFTMHHNPWCTLGCECMELSEEEVRRRHDRGLTLLAKAT